MWIRYGPRTWKRIEFYVKAGLVPRMPSPYQLKQASEQQYAVSAIPERVKYYCRHPLDLFPTAKKARALRQPNQIVAAGYGAMSSSVASATNSGLNGVGSSQTVAGRQGEQAAELTLDRMMRLFFLFSPIRLAAHLMYNPWFLVPGTGLEVPTKYMVAHVAHGPHPFPLWDLQVLQADEGGLEWLERELEIRSRGMDVKSRIYRALAQRDGYYDYLRGLIPRIRRFEYPPVPIGFDPRWENIVTFLNYAISVKSPS
jgi:hypothetical protein